MPLFWIEFDVFMLFMMLERLLEPFTVWPMFELLCIVELVTDWLVEFYTDE